MAGRHFAIHIKVKRYLYTCRDDKQQKLIRNQALKALINACSTPVDDLEDLLFEIKDKKFQMMITN